MFDHLAILSVVSALIQIVETLCPKHCTCMNKPTVNVVCESLENIPMLLNPRLTSLTVRNSLMSHINADDLVFYSELQYLDLSYNNISRVEPNSLNLPKLKFLNLANNQLSSITGKMFTNSPNLEELNLSHNRLSDISDSAFSDLRQLRVLNLRKNSLRQIPVELDYLQGELDLSHNLISSDSELLEFQGSFVRKLDFSHNQLTKLSSFSFSNLVELELLNLSNNLVNSVEDYTFAGLHQLKLLDLSNNQLDSLPLTQSFDSLKQLILSGNNFSSIPTKFLYKMSSLDTLTINDCSKLMKITAHSFGELQNLKLLSIANNSALSTIDSRAFSNLSSLVQVNLMANNLSSLPSTLFADSPKLYDVQLSGNRWHCDCNLSWAATDPKFYEIVCSTPTRLFNRQLSSLKLSEFECNANGQDNIYSGILAGILSVVIAILAIFSLTLLIVFRHRRKLLSSLDCLNCCRLPPTRVFTKGIPKVIRHHSSFRILAEYPVPITEL